MDFIKLTLPADKKPEKISKVLYFLYQGGTLNRFEAQKSLNCDDLSSDIFKLMNEYQIDFESQNEIVRCSCGISTVCHRYWIDGQIKNLEQAYLVLTELFGYQPTYKPVA